MLRRITLLAVLAALVATPFAGAAQNPDVRSDYNVYVEAEIREPQEMAARGQRTCAPEASIGGTATCPSTVLGAGAPLEGVRMLDAVYFSDGLGDPSGDTDGVRRDAEALQSTGSTSGSTNHYAVLADANRGMNLNRLSNGLVPDVILPGRGSWAAWYGYWNDTNGDKVIQVHWSGQYSSIKPKASNEWKPHGGARMVAYVEPGSHPMPTHMSRPDAFTPDFYLRYVSSEISYRSEGEFNSGVVSVNHVIFTDGSLLQDVWTTIVTDPFLAPDGQNPFTETAESLVDVDRHPAAVPDAAPVYGTLIAPTTNELGSPSIGYCPNGCRIGPVAGDTPVHGVLASITSDFYVGYKQESTPGSTSTNEGRDYESEYLGWVDLIPLWSPAGGPASALAGPMPGRNPDGSQTMLPGVLSFELFAGVWRDLNRDGFIGALDDVDDPYERGTRPIADDYYNARGEFFGSYAQVSATNANRLTTFKVIVTPHTTWGSAVPLDGSGNPCYGPSIPYTQLTCVQNGVFRGGSAPIAVELTWDNGVVGRYGASGVLHHPVAILMPEGSPGFSVCTPDLHIPHEIGGSKTVEKVRDCDDVARRV